MKTTLEELQAFIAIVDQGSITAAAEDLEQTPSGISRTLSRLENKLGVTLLRRTTRKIDVTSEGESFLQKAREILQALEAAEESVGSQEKPSGILRIDSASPFILHSVIPHLEEFRDLYPDIQLELHSSERNVDLLENRIDVAIRIGPLADSSLHAVLLGTSKRRLLASPEYIKKYGVVKSVEDLKGHHLLGFTSPLRLNNWPLRYQGENFFTAKPQIKASSGETLLQLCRNGAGIAVLGDFMTLPDRQSGKLLQVLAGATVDEREEIHAVYYKNNRLSLRAEIFIKFLKKKLRDL